MSGETRGDTYVDVMKPQPGHVTRSDTVAGDVIIDYWIGEDGAEAIKGVEILSARDVRVDGRRVWPVRPA